MNTTSIFAKNIDAYVNKTDQVIIANQGGQGSGKTYSILQLLYLIAIKKKKHITIASYTLPHLKSGAMKDFDSILMGEGMEIANVKNKSESTYYLRDSIIEFVGIEGNEAKATGPRRDILYINEANRKIKYEVFDLMNSRTHDCTFIDFNPNAEFWFHEKVMPNFPYKLIKSTYQDNPFLPERERQNILMKKGKPGFENWWRVYGEGEIGTLEGAIFPNWKYGEFNDHLPYQFGLDYGFSPDPDALVKVAISRKEKKIWAQERIYSNTNGTEDLRTSMKLYVKRDDSIVAESASPRTNKDLKITFPNLKAVMKTRTVVDWIREMQDYEIIITEDSYNLAKELNNYIWNDQKAGIPMDAFNHLIDAIRYVYMMQSYQPITVKVHN